MAIDNENLYIQKYKEHNTTAASTDFLRDYLFAVTRTLLDIEYRVGLSATAPTTIDDDIELADYYFNVLNQGVDFYLWQTGRWGQKDPQFLQNNYEKSMREAHGYYLMNTDHDVRLGEVT